MENKAYKIFLSYGRDEYAQMAERLKIDLVKRGHEVWFDRDRLKAGCDWEQYIEEGLEFVGQGGHDDSGRVLFIMTPHSVRRPDGFCLNELSRAISRSIPIVPAMLVYTEPPLSICRLQYLDFQDCYPPEQKECAYEQRFERLLLSLEKNKIDSDGFQGKAINSLQPINFSTDIDRLLVDFTGRKWVINEISDWILDEKGAKVFWLTGVPGSGKSSMAAWVRNTFREVAAFHFCDIHSEEKRDPAKMVCSIVYQLSTQLPEYEARLKSINFQQIIQQNHESYTLFEKLVVDLISGNFPHPGRLIIILIDALDEATYRGNNDILPFLSISISKTPDWFKFLITSRPDPLIMTTLQSLSPYILDTSHPENKEDIKIYLEKKMPSITFHQINLIIQKSEGVFLYVKKVVESISSHQLSLDRIEDFPQGLGSIYYQDFDRQFKDNLTMYKREVRPLLSIILAGMEPIRSALLYRIAGMASKMDFWDILNSMGSLISQRTGQTDEGIRLYHRSLMDWLTDQSRSGMYFIDAEFGHEKIADHGWGQFLSGAENLADYHFHYLPRHLHFIGRYEELAKLLKDFTYCMETTKRGFLESLLKAYQDLVPQLPARYQNQLIHEQTFFREKAHILRRGNEKWPAYMILFQMAIEHADNSPLTIAAEKYLSDGKVEWQYLRSIERPKDFKNNSLLSVFEGHKQKIEDLIFLGSKKFVSSDHKNILFWTEDGTIISRILQPFPGLSRIIPLLGGNFLYWGSTPLVLIIDNAGRIQTSISGHVGKITGIITLRDGNFITWGEDKTARVYTREGQLLSILFGHEKEILRAMELSSGNILTYSIDNTIKIWTCDGTLLQNLDKHDAEIKGVIELSGNHILSWSDDKTMRMWNIANGLEILFKGHLAFVSGAIEIGSGKILSWAFDNTLRIWDFNGRLRRTHRIQQVTIEKVVQLSNNDFLIWSMAKELSIMNIQGKIVCQLSIGESFIEGAFELSNGNILAWFGDFSIRIFSNTGDLLARFKGHNDPIKEVKEFYPGKIYSKSNDNSVKFWDIYHVISTSANDHKGRITGIIRTESGRLVTWGYDQVIKVWDMDGQVLHELLGHEWWVERVIELKDNKLLSWSLDQSIRIWNSDGVNEYCFFYDEIINPPESIFRTLGIGLDDWLDLIGTSSKKRKITDNRKSVLKIKGKNCRINMGSFQNTSNIFWHSEYELTGGMMLSNNRAVVTSAGGTVSFLSIS